ncbi:MAG: HIT family protein [Rhabdochlamydiaceae bacterium]|nr:HIT family protein [Rhabdochlamydiaceae bacterium]
MATFSTQIAQPIPYEHSLQTLSDRNEDVIVVQGTSLNIVIPKAPLSHGSVQIIPQSDASHFSQWSTQQHQEAHSLIQRVANAFKKEGITDYMVYGKESPDASFRWEVVPYTRSNWSCVNIFWRFWQQFKVLWKISFGGGSYSNEERQNIAETLRKNLDPSAAVAAVPKAVKTDPFCNPEIIKKQCVFEGKHINVLYDYAPLTLGKDRLHFLLVPKHHCSKFTELTAEEYIESKKISQKLQKHYQAKGFNTAYQFAKTGLQAGQTVPHYHEHIVFTDTKTQESLGKLRVLGRMLFGSSALKKDELQSRVAALKVELERPLSV